MSDFNIEKQIFKYMAGGEKEGWGKETWKPTGNLEKTTYDREKP